MPVDSISTGDRIQCGSCPESFDPTDLSGVFYHEHKDLPLPLLAEPGRRIEACKKCGASFRGTLARALILDLGAEATDPLRCPNGGAHEF